MKNKINKGVIAEILGEMSVLLALTDANPFKIRAYARASEIVATLKDDLDDLVKSGKLTDVEGIGENLAKHIEELSRTGGLEAFEKLKKEVPAGVVMMLKVPGLGPKRIRFIWKKLNIDSVGELEIGLTRGLLDNVPGFGKKLVEKILAGIEMMKRFAGKRLLSEGYLIASALTEIISSWKEVERAEVAGSIRRRKEVVKDIDIIVVTKKPSVVMNRFVSMPEVEKVIQHGDKKSEVFFKAGIQCDLRTFSKEEFPFALHYFTGSKEHNIKMRSLAKKRGFKLNEYGLFKGKSARSIGCRDEAELFEALGLSFVPPELREDTGEIEAAAEGKLPKLIEEKDLNGIVHVHTTYTDGTATVEEMARAARSLGYEYIAICDHSQAVTIAGGMRPKDVLRQHREIEKLNKKNLGIAILKGIEVDIMADGTLDYPDDVLASFDFVIASVHSRFGMKEDEMTSRITTALSNKNVDALAHPTGRLLLSRDAYAVDLKKVIDTAARFKKAIEINAHPQRLDLDWRWVKYAKDSGVDIVISPDAHVPEGLEHMIMGVWTARKGWLEKVNVLNCLTAKEFLKRFSG